jgi:hypothetical protein
MVSMVSILPTIELFINLAMTLFFKRQQHRKFQLVRQGAKRRTYMV